MSGQILIQLSHKTFHHYLLLFAAYESHFKRPPSHSHIVLGEIKIVILVAGAQSVMVVEKEGGGPLDYLNSFFSLPHFTFYLILGWIIK